MRTTTVDGFYIEDVEIVQWEGIGQEPATSTVGNARIYFNPITGKLRISEDGGEWKDLFQQPVSDHGELTGLSDDDHSQYHNDTRGDARYLKKDGSNADETIDIGSQDFTTTGEITGEMAKVQASAPTEQVGNLWLDPSETSVDTTDHAELSNLDYANSGHTGFEPARGDDDNYVTDAEKTVLANTSGTNTGDQDLSDYAKLTDTAQDITANSFVTDGGTSAQTLQGDGSLVKSPMTLVDTASPDKASSVTFSGLIPAVKYLLVYDFVQNTSAGYPAITFNADSGNNYVGARLSSAESTAAGGKFTARADLLAFYYAVPATYPCSLELMFGTLLTDTTKVFVLSRTTHYASTPTGYVVSVCSGLYDGASDLSSMTLTATAGTMTGTAKLYRLN